MRRRLDLAVSLVAEPPILFLDEPTTGLDPRSRLSMWELISELVAGGTTLLLSTQYLEEADRLADRISVVDNGRAIATGTSAELKAQVGGERLEATVSRREGLGPAVETFERHGDGPAQVEEERRHVVVPMRGGARKLPEVVRELDLRGVELDDLAVRLPTLDDVFLTLTGHAAEEQPPVEEPREKEEVLG